MVLSACAPKTIYLVKTEFKLLALEKEHTQFVTVPFPPPKELFLSKSSSEQRTLLADYSLSLQSSLQQCNRQLISIEELQVKQLETLRIKNLENSKGKP